jgi:hypothetical protein
MLTIDNRIFTHLDFDETWKSKSTPKAVSENSGKTVRRYRQLLDFVSELNYGNPRFDILYRGQGEDYQTGKSGLLGETRSSIYPSIFRPRTGRTVLRPTVRVGRFEKLDQLSKDLIKAYPLEGRIRLKMFKEVQWAILQHYNKTKTPLIDVTDSLLAAASFAYQNRNEKDVGYLYAFGIPHQQGSISYHVDERMVVVKLASACPPEARRAHRQHAYFVGNFPNQREPSKSHNLASRMIAKFRLDFRKFWIDGFYPLEEDMLFPKKDSMRELVKEL